MGFEGHCRVVWGFWGSIVLIRGSWVAVGLISTLGAVLAARRPTMPMGLMGLVYTSDAADEMGINRDNGCVIF